jgi:crotonobetainyl-CoA:carnitine CoA-transferase CaiB-like acyl-CoA transferase
MRLVGRPDLIDEPWFRNHTGRLEHQDELDEAIGSWIGERDSAEVIRAFEEVSAAIAPVMSIADIVEDPQFLARESITTVEHPVLGPLRMQNVIPLMGETPGRIRSCGPDLGADNEEILSALGYEEAEREELARNGVIAAQEASSGRR